MQQHIDPIHIIVQYLNRTTFASSKLQRYGVDSTDGESGSGIRVSGRWLLKTYENGSKMDENSVIS